MTSKQFMFAVCAGVATVAVLAGLVNVYVDMYGLFQHRRTRTLSMYGEERTAKYLHSFHYIPENFDGVLLGSSVSDSFDTMHLSNYAIYNASINGGNVEDLLPLAENIYRSRKLKLTILCAHRYLTNDHVKKTDLMTSRQFWGALGSPQLLTAYVSSAAARLGVVSSAYDGYGNLHYGKGADLREVHKGIGRAVQDILRGRAAVGNYHIDPVAFDHLRHIVALAQEHSDQVIVYYPPTPAPVLAIRSAEVKHYRESIRTLLGPAVIEVDFNVPKYADLRSDERNFIDAVHLSKRGSALVLAELNTVIASWRPDRVSSLPDPLNTRGLDAAADQVPQ